MYVIRSKSRLVCQICFYAVVVVILECATNITYTVKKYLTFKRRIRRTGCFHDIRVIFRNKSEIKHRFRCKKEKEKHQILINYIET